MADTAKSWVECLLLVFLNTIIMKCSWGLSPFEIVHGRLYAVPEFHLGDTPEQDNDECNYMEKMLKKQYYQDSLFSTRSRSQAQSTEAWQLDPGEDGRKEKLAFNNLDCTIPSASNHPYWLWGLQGTTTGHPPLIVVNILLRCVPYKWLLTPFIQASIIQLYQYVDQKGNFYD